MFYEIILGKWPQFMPIFPLKALYITSRKYSLSHTYGNCQTAYGLFSFYWCELKLHKYSIVWEAIIVWACPTNQCWKQIWHSIGFSWSFPYLDHIFSITNNTCSFTSISPEWFDKFNTRYSLVRYITTALSSGIPKWTSLLEIVGKYEIFKKNRFAPTCYICSESGSTTMPLTSSRTQLSAPCFLHTKNNYITKSWIRGAKRMLNLSVKGFLKYLKKPCKR